MAPVLAQYKDALFVAYATDGSDNLSDVAGAWVDAATVNKLKAKGIDIDAALRNSDSYTALNEIGQVLKTGEFHANINDVYIISPCS
jgi:hydroxypyruvate reductase